VFALITGSAGALRLDRYSFADSGLIDVGSDCDYRSGGFVPQRHRRLEHKGSDSPFSEVVHIRPAHAHGRDSHQHLIAVWGRHDKVLRDQGHRAFEHACAHCLHLHTSNVVAAITHLDSRKPIATI
jgi:hypothetical protein